MDSCCQNKVLELEALQARHRRLLQWVLGINALMFFVEVASGIYARSSAVLADGLDMFGDSAVYALSLYTLSRGIMWRARASLAKGVVMAVFGAGVVVQALVAWARGGVPHAQTMGTVGVLALGANAICFVMLYRHRSDDLNMRSTWLCSRNDIIANVSVLAASAAVAVLHSGWPDIVIGLAIACLFLQSAVSVLRDALGELRDVGKTSAAQG